MAAVLELARSIFRIVFSMRFGGGSSTGMWSSTARVFKTEDIRFCETGGTTFVTALLVVGLPDPETNRLPDDPRRITFDS